VAQSGVETRIRVAAIVGLKNSKDERVLSLLQDLATNSSDETIVAASLFALSQHGEARATEILRAISLKAKTLKGRKQALYFFSLKDGAGVIESLIQIYDGENDEAIKAQILYSLSESKEKVALRKLVDVVRNDPSVKLRLAATHFLSQSTDPEARKFVEGVIK
jgi:HEAT repeat protein